MSVLLLAARRIGIAATCSLQLRQKMSLSAAAGAGTSSTGDSIKKKNSLGGGKSIIAVGQMCATNDVAHNLCQVEELAAQAQAKSAVCLYLPECCDFVAENRAQTLQLAEPLSGPRVQCYRDIARRHGIWLSLGGIHERICDGTGASKDKIHNAHVIINTGGDVVSVYRKLHLFDVNTSEMRFHESHTVVPGNRLITPVDTPNGKLGLLICYDVRFAEAAVLLRKWGAEMLSYPSAFAYVTGQAHWELLLRARAIETQCYVIAAAQVGYHNKKRRSWGHAMVVDPWGRVLADCGPTDKLAVATAEIDLSALAGVRENMPCFDHRSSEAYSLTAYNSCAQPRQDRSFAQHTIRHETIFYETEHSYAFTNLRCVVEGHVLVSTKRITPRLNGLNCVEMADLFIVVCRVQRMLETIYGTTSATVTVQDGAEAGQTVPHVHFHVMPRRPGDFGHNDQVYVKLEDRCDDKPPRDLSERIAEAQKYRDFLQA